jgi:hypothetical protein
MIHVCRGKKHFFRYPGNLYNNKLYMYGYGANSRYYDLLTNTWLAWPASPLSTGLSPCMVTWRDSFIVFGGYDPRNSVQVFNHTTQVHTGLPYGSFAYKSKPIHKYTMYKINQKNSFILEGLGAGLPDFSWHNIPKRGICIK